MIIRNGYDIVITNHWHYWFPWIPVKTIEGNWRWMVTVQRRKTYRDDWDKVTWPAPEIVFTGDEYRDVEYAGHTMRPGGDGIPLES